MAHGGSRRACGWAPPTGGKAQEIETDFAIPSQTLAFAAHYVAHDVGFFKKERFEGHGPLPGRNRVGTVSRTDTAGGDTKSVALRALALLGTCALS